MARPALPWLPALLLAAATGCDRPGDCPEGSVFSPLFGQCVGVEEEDAPAPDPTPTGDTGS